jgi:hypothetical protein
MFVSSYSTYIDTSTTKRVQNERDDTEKKVSKSSYNTKLTQNINKNVSSKSDIPLNYISDYKALNNRQKLSEQDPELSKSTSRFTKLSSMDSASVAYTDNSKMFSLVQKPKQAIDQTPKLDKNLSEPAQEKQESVIRKQMINTYVSNENYYKITAA